MKTMLKIKQIFINGLYYDPLVLVSYIFSYVFGTKKSNINIFDFYEFSEKISSGLSVIRIGDGEAMLMTGRDIHYQKTSLELKAGLRGIIDNYSGDSPFILSLPVEALLSDDSTLKSKGRYKIWRLFRCFAKLRIKFNLKYADAHIFYHKEYLEKLLPPLIRNRHIILICKKSLFDNTLSKYLKNYTESLDFIEVPEKNSFEDIDRIYTATDTRLSKAGDLKPIILVSAGPASKVLAYNYSLKGIQTIDMGHGMEILGRDVDYSDKV